MIVEVRKRFSRSFSLGGNWTFSRATDEATDFVRDYQAADQANLCAERAARLQLGVRSTPDSVRSPDPFLTTRKLHTGGGTVGELSAMKTEKDPSAYLEGVREYWRTAHRAYLESVGTTFQAGLINLGPSEDPVTQSNLHLAAAAGIRPGHRVLDAGCGVCGPSMDIARHIEGVQITAVTISPEQAATAKKLIRQARLSSQIEVRIADYHRLPFPDGFFDVVCFFESVGYSYDLSRLFSEVFRVTRPGGGVYIKDVFCKARPLSRAAREELAEFNRIFAQFQTPTLSHVRKALAVAGFEQIRGRDLTKRITTAHSLNAMFDSRNGSLRPTEFGKLHFGVYRCAAVCFGEIKAIRPVRKRHDRRTRRTVSTS